MSIERAETLKRELTDKYVVVSSDVPELRRFSGLTGQIKTVNMNCRALVQFNGPEDIAWYDIDPSYLTVVDKPIAKPKAAEAPAKPAAKPAAKKAGGGKSPLEMARAQGAAKEGKPSPLEQARQQGAAGQAKPSGGKKLSPLELARQQGAAGSGSAAKAEQPTEKKLSPLELARQQGAAGSGTPTEQEPAETPESEAPAGEQSAEQASPAPTTGPDGKPLSKIEQARLQGPFKG